MREVNAMVIDFKPAGEPGTRAEFSYHMTSATISITGKGRLSVGKNLEWLRAKSNTGIKPLSSHSASWPGMAGALARRSVGWQNGNLFSTE
jgi:hypothetical protein